MKITTPDSANIFISKKAFICHVEAQGMGGLRTTQCDHKIKLIKNAEFVPKIYREIKSKVKVPTDVDAIDLALEIN